MTNLLPITILMPTLGAGCLWVIGGGSRAAARQSALVTALMTLVLAGLVVRDFSTQGANLWYPLNDTPDAVAASGVLNSTSIVDVHLSLGLDGLGIWLFGLSALLTLSGVLVSWEAIDDRPALFYALLLLLETGLLGLFAARDIILFYVFFEFTLIPLFFLIGVWGSEQRRYAAVKFFLFTLAGSLLTFLGLLTIVLWNSMHGTPRILTFSIDALTRGLAAHPMESWMQTVIFLALFAGFAIKVPLFPLHTWLPLAHVQAPTAGSVLLAGVLLKVGTYGFVRFNLPMLPAAAALLAPWLLWLSVAGIVYGALVALAQTDIKKLIAYSSVSHLGFCMLGVFAINRLGMQGGVLQMINHGLSTGALFAIVGMIYERYHTREISQLGGLARRLPRLATCMVFFSLASIGLPGLNGFAGEFLLLTGMFQRGWAESPLVLGSQLKIISVLAVSGVVLGAWYMLWLVQRTMFGPLREPEHRPGEPPIRDLSLREIGVLAPLAVFVIWIGLHPDFFLRRMSPALDGVTQTVAASWHEQYDSAQTAAAPPAVGSAVWTENNGATSRPDLVRTADPTETKIRAAEDARLGDRTGGD